jgi:hypothetical protein
LRAKPVSILQSEVLGPVRGGLSEMRPWCRDHLQYVVQPKGCPLTRNAQTHKYSLGSVLDNLWIGLTAKE